MPGISNLTLELGPSVAVHPVENKARDPAIALRRTSFNAFIRFTFLQTGNVRSFNSVLFFILFAEGVAGTSNGMN
jgi:hypothetical protein